jgi:nucleotide-binding universal stress UspA family protein
MSASLEEQNLRVLAGIDLTERSRHAFARAVDLARTPGASLSLLHVTSDAMPNQLALAHEVYAGEVLRDLAMKAQAEGAKGVECILVRGRDYETIIEEARKTHSDVIVIGTHRPSSLVQDLLGTTADRVLRLGGLPVLLVKKKPAGAYASILVAVDFSQASRRALDFAVRTFPQARICTITAYGSARRSLLGDDAVEREAAAETRRLALKGFLDEARQAAGPAFEGTFAKIVAIVERGWAEDIIVRTAEAEKPDLIVMGTHARGGLQHAVLGSVAEWVLTQAPCDVLAVPPGD